MGLLKERLTRSIFKKQIVAITGLIMVAFVIGHLAGNLLILLGPEVFNAYADTLASLGELVWFARIGLLIALLLHLYFTIRLVRENRAARGARYAVSGDRGSTTFAKKTMILTGLLVFAFLFIHIKDFTLGDKSGPPSVVSGLNEGESLGLYGLVWNSFLLSEHAWRPILYVAAMCFIGMHLSHGVQSTFQSIGFFHDKYTPWIRKVSVALGVIIAAGFSSIPFYINIVGTPSP